MIATALTEMFGLAHPLVLAPMGNVSGGRLAAAVSNDGGLGLVGGQPAAVRQLEGHRTLELRVKRLPHDAESTNSQTLEQLEVGDRPRAIPAGAGIFVDEAKSTAAGRTGNVRPR